MRKALTALSIAALAATLVLPASAAPLTDDPYAPAVGAVGGTVFGLGISEGWWGATLAGGALPTTVAGAAALGGVAGIGGVALVDAAVQPCAGFQAMLLMNEDYCAQLNGYGPRVASYQGRHMRHYVR